MVPDTEKLLKRLDESVQELCVFFRTRQSLTESEQLFIENRLMILQIEYNIWARDKRTGHTRTAGTNKKRTARERPVDPPAASSDPTAT
jgi:hypothetical protein